MGSAVFLRRVKYRGATRSFADLSRECLVARLAVPGVRKSGQHWQCWKEGHS